LPCTVAVPVENVHQVFVRRADERKRGIEDCIAHAPIAANSATRFMLTLRFHSLGCTAARTRL
jgi:hypothetical protein